MKLEISYNTLEENKNIRCFNDWWFELGISLTPTEFYKNYNYVLTLSLLFFSIYLRFGRNK